MLMLGPLTHPASWLELRFPPLVNEENGPPKGRTALGSLRFQGFSDLVPVLNEQRLSCMEILQKPHRFRNVAAVPGKVRDPLLLLRDVSFTAINMPLGLLQMADMHCAIGRRNGADHGSLPSYAGGSAIGLSGTDAYGSSRCR
jgi:hypothetical protein